jgi:hypothetical protein
MKASTHRGQTISYTGTTKGELEKDPGEMIHCPDIYGKDEYKRPNLLLSACEERQKTPSLKRCYGGCAYDKDGFIPPEGKMPPDKLQAKAVIFLALAITEDRSNEEVAKIGNCSYNTGRVYKNEWKKMSAKKKMEAAEKSMTHFIEIMSSKMEKEERQ